MKKVCDRLTGGRPRQSTAVRSHGTLRGRVPQAVSAELGLERGPRALSDRRHAESLAGSSQGLLVSPSGG